MYQLKAKNISGEIVTLDEVPDDFAEAHDAAYCGQYWPNYTDFELVKVDSVHDE